MRSTVIALPLAAAACSPVDQKPPAPTAAETQTEPGSVDLQGNWRVAGIDGEPIDTPYAITLVADESNILWEPACAGQYRGYSISGETFAAPIRNNNKLEVCAIGFPEELPRIWSALEAAERIERTPENAVLISGNGRSVTLFSQ